MPLVTAIITTYKRQASIVQRALESVLMQTHSNIEVIVVDDSPCDFEYREEVRTMIESYCTRNVRYIAHEVNQGACAARNTGIAAANGEYVAFLDDDDEWKPEKTERQLAKFTDDSISLVYCGREVMSDDTGSISVPATRFLRGMVFSELIKENFIGSTSFPLIRKSCLETIFGFDVLMQSAQDYDVWLRLAEKYSVDYCEEPLVVYHVHSGERISKNYKSKISGLQRINEKNNAYLKEHKEAKWIRTIKIAPEYAGDGKMGKAFKVWYSAVCISPNQVAENIMYFFRICKIFLRNKVICS